MSLHQTKLQIFLLKLLSWCSFFLVYHLTLDMLLLTFFFGGGCIYIDWPTFYNAAGCWS